MLIKKGIARWDSKLIKGDRQKGSRISILVKGGRQMGPHISCWLKGIARWDSKLRRIAVKDKFQINQASTRSVSGILFWVYLYQTYCAKPLLRKHYKEGASVVTHFWVPPIKI